MAPAQPNAMAKKGRSNHFQVPDCTRIVRILAIRVNSADCWSCRFFSEIILSPVPLRRDLKETPAAKRTSASHGFGRRLQPGRPPECRASGNAGADAHHHEVFVMSEDLC